MPDQSCTMQQMATEMKDQPQYKPVLIDENFETGHKSNWTTWKCLNRLPTCSKEQRKKLGYCKGDTTCKCGLAPEDTKHVLQCPLLAQPCSLDDLLEFNGIAKNCMTQEGYWSVSLWNCSLSLVGILFSTP